MFSILRIGHKWRRVLLWRKIFFAAILTSWATSKHSFYIFSTCYMQQGWDIKPLIAAKPHGLSQKLRNFARHIESIHTFTLRCGTQHHYDMRCFALLHNKHSETKCSYSAMNIICKKLKITLSPPTFSWKVTIFTCKICGIIQGWPHNGSTSQLPVQLWSMRWVQC